MGFTADVSFFRPAHRRVDRDTVDWSRRVPRSVQRSFCSDEPEYDLFDPGVQDVAKELRRGRPNPVRLVERVWRFVNGHMKADLPPRPNTGAEVLRLGEGLCGEYTRLTVTLLRACELPARETHAFGMFVSGPMSNDHAWADVYLPGAGWTPVQPQEDLPIDGQFPLHYYRYLVVFRGVSFLQEHRVIEHTNVIQNRASGVGFFADVPESHREQVIRLLRAIAADDGTNARRLLARVSDAHVRARPLLYWALAASGDDAVGRRAASRLVDLCRDERNRLELARFADASPTLVRFRIDRAAGELPVPDQAREFDGNMYYVYDKKMTWSAAKKYCELLGGHLVTITSQDEQDFVQSLPEALGKGHRFWIGLSQDAPDSPWQWVTGERLEYSNWARGFPDPSKPLWSMRIRPEVRSPQADYAALPFAPNRWIDAEGEQLKGFVCEWEGSPEFDSGAR